MSILASPLAKGYESDQFSNRAQPLRDASPLLDAWVNETIAEVAEGWRGAPDPLRFATKVYSRLGWFHWVDHLERWVKKSDGVERLEQKKPAGLYRGASIAQTKVAFLFGVSPTFRLAGSLVGTDKLSHFVSLGFKYYQRYSRGVPISRILSNGARWEKWVLGLTTTNVFSNADLVANYEGLRFFRSLTEDNVIPGKPAIVRWEGERVIIQRPFRWQDHVNDYWDEALNPSFLGRSLQRHFDAKVPILCSEYHRQPEIWSLTNESELDVRYKGLAMRPTPSNRLDIRCFDTE